MINVKNVSSKVIGIPNVEGGNTALLPDETAQVEDQFKDQLAVYADAGLIEIGSASKVAKAEDEPVDNVETEKKTRGRRKAVED